MNDLKQISDLTNPSTWYPQARSKLRKIIFHAGPTNSGKTYQAMQRFLNAKSGIYCGPLKLLAMEVFQKSNEKVRLLFYSTTISSNIKNLLFLYRLTKFREQLVIW